MRMLGSSSTNRTRMVWAMTCGRDCWDARRILNDGEGQGNRAYRAMLNVTRGGAVETHRMSPDSKTILRSGRLGHKAKWEYFRALYERYRKAGREAKRVMLNEFCWNTGYNRKYAIRLVNGPAAGKPAERRAEDDGRAMAGQGSPSWPRIWEAAGYPWSVRLKALLPGCPGLASATGCPRR